MKDVSFTQPSHVSSSPAPVQPMKRSRQQTFFWSAAGVVSALAIFVLPFAFPPPVPTFSTSYTYGFNNRVAELSAVAISFAVVIFLWATHSGRARIADSDSPPNQISDKIPRSWLLYASLAVILFTAVLGGFMVHSGIYYSDASYYLTQIGRITHDHVALYRDVEFAYGPIFFYLPTAVQIALGHVGIPPEPASMVSLVLQQIAGLWMLTYILNWLPLSRRIRGLALALFTFGTLTPLLGMNYTLLRFLIPQVLFLGILRSRSPAAQTLLFAVAQFVALGCSAEVGAALLGGVGCYALYRCFTSGWKWLAPAFSVLASTALFAAVMNKDYFAVMGHYAVGGFNLVVMPDFHVLILLIATIALSPIVVAGYLQTRSPRAAAMLGFFAISLAMMIPGLGRCDALHTFYSGVGVYLLSLAAVGRLRTIPARVWVVAIVTMVVANQVDDFRVYKVLMRQAVFPNPEEDMDVDFARLEVLTHGQRVAAPIVTPWHTTRDLIRLGQYEPSYYVFMVGVWDDPSERRKIADMRHAPYALVADWKYETAHPDFETSLISRVFRFGYRYHPNHAPWIQGALLQQELAVNWTLVGKAGDYLVYHQNGR